MQKGTAILQGKDDLDQLKKIFEVRAVRACVDGASLTRAWQLCGTPTEDVWPGVTALMSTATNVAFKQTCKRTVRERFAHWYGAVLCRALPRDLSRWQAAGGAQFVRSNACAGPREAPNSQGCHESCVLLERAAVQDATRKVLSLARAPCARLSGVAAILCTRRATTSSLDAPSERLSACTRRRRRRRRRLPARPPAQSLPPPRTPRQERRRVRTRWRPLHRRPQRPQLRPGPRRPACRTHRTLRVPGSHLVRRRPRRPARRTGRARAARAGRCKCAWSTRSR